MNEMILPQHVVQRLERRWASKFPPFGKARRRTQVLSCLQPTRRAQAEDPLRSPHVRGWLNSSLLPPATA